MKNLKDICEGILTGVNNDVDIAVKQNEILTYLKHPEMFDWDEFYSVVSGWCSGFKKATGSYADKKLCGDQPIAYICKCVDKISDDHFKLRLNPGDKFIILFLTEQCGAKIYAKDPRGKTVRKNVPAWSSLAIAHKTTGGKNYSNISDLPWYDEYYQVLSDHVEEYGIPKNIVKKISLL